MLSSRLFAYSKSRFLLNLRTHFVQNQSKDFSLTLSFDSFLLVFGKFVKKQQHICNYISFFGLDRVMFKKEKRNKYKIHLFKVPGV